MEQVGPRPNKCR